MSVKIRTKSAAKKRLSYYLDIYQNGHRHYEFLFKAEPKDKETRLLAEQIRAKRELEVHSQTYGFNTMHLRKANFVDFVSSIAAEKPGTEKAWRCTEKHLKDFTNGLLPFTAVNESWLAAFQTYLCKKVAANTASSYFTKIKAALNLAVKQGILTSSPASKVSPIKKTETRREFLEIEELERLEKTPCQDNEVKAAFLFSCFTGLRLSDVERLTWQNVAGNRLEFIQKKTSTLEYLPLTAQAIHILKSQQASGKRDDAKRVFKLPNPDWVNVQLKRWTEAAQIKKHITFHSGRHTYATLALTLGADLYAVSKMLGHTSIQHTQIYAKIIDRKKQAVADLFPVLGQKSASVQLS